jgi:hypothetical protein
MLWVLYEAIRVNPDSGGTLVVIDLHSDKVPLTVTKSCSMKVFFSFPLLTAFMVFEL